MAKENRAFFVRVKWDSSLGEAFCQCSEGNVAVENSISWGKMGFFTELQLGTKSKEILEIMDGVIWVRFRKTMKLTQSNMG